MSDHDPFLLTILDNPHDAGPRLVYADWLEEHGDTHRAQYLRLDCERVGLPDLHPRRDELAKRLVSLFYARGKRWTRPVLNLPARTIAERCQAVLQMAPLCEVVADLRQFRNPAAPNVLPEPVARHRQILPLCWSTRVRYLVDPYPRPWRWRDDRYVPPLRNPRTLVVAAVRKFLSDEALQRLEADYHCNVVDLTADHAQMIDAIERHYPEDDFVLRD
jgi:uncharacterized protein (TIGR02996 family)